MGRRYRNDSLDMICYDWAKTRRELLGLTIPKRGSDYVGQVACTLGRIRVLHDSAAVRYRQSFPEVYLGDSARVNRAFHSLPLPLRIIFDVHYVIHGVPVTVKADVLALSIGSYFSRLRQARAFVEGFLAAKQI